MERIFERGSRTDSISEKFSEKVSEKMSDRVTWIRELVQAEEQMEESGVVDIHAGQDPHKILNHETFHYLNELKTNLVEATTTFNELKTSALGRVKIYGIAKTQADFMLFRNGFKMIFSYQEPGKISIRFNFLSPQSFLPNQIPTVQQNGPYNLMEEHVLEASLGPFGELTWSFKGQPIRLDSVVRYHMSLFIRESTK